jgi:hypothetical protein
MRVDPKVSVFVEAADRTVNVIEERFGIATLSGIWLMSHCFALLRDPADLPFADYKRRLIPPRMPLPDRSPRIAVIRFLMNRWLLDDVVQIRRRSGTTAPAEFTALLQLGDRARPRLDARPR